MSGKLELAVGEDKHQLSEGDAIYFDCGVPHGYRLPPCGCVIDLGIWLDNPSEPFRWKFAPLAQDLKAL